MSAIGRISGPLLKSNLTRNGIDLAFETDLLYLDVNNQRIGIKNATPQYELDITGTTRTIDIRVTNRADIGDINVLGNTIWSDNQYLNLGTLDNVVYNNKLRVDDIDVEGNVISTNTSNSNLELRPNGTGTVEVLADMNVSGNIHATGNISADGSITLGDADTDNVTFNAEIASNLVPDQDRTYALGSPGTQYASGTDYTLGDATIVITSGTGTLSVPAAGVAWIDDVTVETTGYYYLITIESQIGVRYSATTTANWSGTNPQTVTVNIPDAPDGTYNVIQINKDAKRWNDIWVRTITTDGINAGSIVVDGINLTLRQGNIYYVSENGDDANYGDHPQDPFGSLSHALSVAATDIGNGELAPTIKITPGVYTETFPLTVPAGVTVKGESLRSVKIIPTTATRYNDAFLLNGETTVEDITIADFYSGGAFHATTASGVGTATLNVGTAPFAHTYVSGGTITFGGNDYAISNAVYTHGTGQLVITHSGPDAGVGTSTFIKNIVFSCNGGNRTFPDNGYALRFATDFEVTSRSPYVKNITVITKGSTTTAEDPRGFNAGDAGKGAYVDGAYATANSKEAAMLFHSVTFITPGVDGLTATNGARIEWLNSFTYFANRGLHAFDSNDGLKGDGKTRIRLSGLTGTAPAAAQTVTFTSTDNSTVVGPLTIDSVEGTDILIVDGKNTDLIGFDTTPATIAFSGGGSATTIENVDVRDFGAEIRMIGSASVYGNFGLVGDGPGVLVYAIGHNLAYVGNGKEVTNETSTVIQANEVIEINNAQIRYNSVDHKGDFRVGDLFYVNQETGSAAFSVSDFIINTTNGVSFNTGSDTTFVDGTKVETGDWRFSGNTVETLTQDANFAAASGEINLLDNTNITGNLDVTGNVTIGGNITIGDEASDTIQFVAGIDSDIIPRLDSTYSLGTATKTWSNLFANEVVSDSIRIRDNFIETTESNADLELRANGTGEVLVPSNNVQIDNNLTVDGTVTLANTAITGTLTLVGDLNQTGNYTLTEDLTVEQNLTVGAAAQFEEILIDDNFITTTTSNTDLELRANGTGEIIVPNNNVNITNNLSVTGDIDANNLTVTATVTSTDANIGDVQISGTTVEATASNADLELRANGTGDVTVPTSDVVISQALQVSGTTDLQNVNLAGVLTHIGNTIQTGNFTLNNGEFTNGNISIDGNTIETTDTNSNLELRANGSGIISIPTNNVTITNDLDVDGITNLDDTNIDGTLTHVGDTAQTGNYTITGQFSNGDIQINANTIETTDTNSDLELRASGTGTINVPNNNVTFSQDLTVSGTTDLQNTNITGTITHVGDTTQTGNLTIGGEISNGNILIEDNFIATTNSNSDLELRANGTGEVLIPSNDVRITNNLFVNGDATLGDTTLTGNVNITGDITQTGDYSITSDLAVGGNLTVTRSAQFEEVLIDDNFVTTTTSNTDLELRANGTGEILIPNNDLHITNDLAVDGTITVGDINSAGTITANRFSTGDILIDDNFITTTQSNSDLELRANGTGDVVVPSNNVTLEQNLTVNGDTDLEDTTVTGTITHVGNTTQTGDFGLTGNLTVSGDVTSSGIELENIQLVGNVLTTTLSNSDLELRANGTGSIVIPNNNVEITGDLTVNGTLTVTDIDSIGTIAANTFHTGDILVDDNFITTTNSNSDLELRAAGTGSIVIDTFGFNNSTISTTGDMTLTPSSEAVIIDATGSLKLPAGDTSQRPTGVAGQLRYNSQLARFEGFNGTNWINLKGVEDLDGDTKITAELSEGANDNKIRFYNAGVLTVDIDANRLNALKVTVDDITVDGNLISTTTNNTDLELTANGTGSVKFDNFAFKNNTITNTVANSVTTFEATDNGYVKFDGTYGLVIPAGGDTQRPPLANTELGQLRWNTDAARTEIYDGANWVSVSGSNAGISRAEAENIAFEIVLSLG
jgi:cytoskeletal protein CcmA (bactofilin family)